ncbi:hypothetical protein DL89DRAFT_322198 [Linderina pennispora]|uniref:Paf1-domain-containing protein n=1 Tax=Linderina pennispora TaxID=61395 RepID=A0A1Y1WB80_9FUNG|nr:uncharacterized protein DL89DRAFT_322198 [Linderina pennispora]ORX70797.1 hypothetical protein DL89DRAFT_322198 [Linderina pennispora]
MSSASKQNKKSIGKEFLCKVRYQNPLPVVPFPPKLLPIPPTYVDANGGSYSQARLAHYVEYRHTTLEEATPYPMHIDADLGMPIDPCMLGTFDEDYRPGALQPQELDPRDEFLLNLPTTTEPAAPAPNTSSTSTSGGPAARPVVRVQEKRKFDHSLEGQLQAIEDTFACYAKYADLEDGQARLLRDMKHPTNSKLTAVEAIPVFPDEHTWVNNYTAFTLDTCPEPQYTSMKNCPDMDAAKRQKLGDEARQSIVFRLRDRTNNFGQSERWVESFLPEDSEMATKIHERLTDGRQAGEQDSGVEYRFEKARDYDLPGLSEAHRQDMYMFTINNGEAVYVPIKSRAMLKRRQVPLNVQLEEERDDPLYVTHMGLQLREMKEEEIQDQQEAMNKLRKKIKEEIVHNTGRTEETDENVDIGDDMFDDSQDIDSAHEDSRRRHRRSASFSSSSSRVDDF